MISLLKCGCQVDLSSGRTCDCRKWVDVGASSAIKISLDWHSGYIKLWQLNYYVIGNLVIFRNLPPHIQTITKGVSICQVIALNFK
jgi:hypothetical protein